MREQLLSVKDEIIVLWAKCDEGTRVYGNLTIGQDKLFYDFTKIESGNDSTVLTAYDSTSDNVIKLLIVCLRFYEDNSFTCTNPCCIICSFKDLDFAGGIAKIAIRGNNSIRHITERMIFPIDIHIIGGHDITTAYGGVKAIKLLQHGFELDCYSINPVESRENYAVKANIQELWVKPIDLSMVKMYPNVKKVYVIKPKFEIIGVHSPENIGKYP